MQLSVFGLGYVGSVTAACLAQRGHSVIGVDVNAERVRLVNEGRSPIVEEGTPALISNAVENGNLRATTCPRDAVENSRLGIICVGTPSRPDGSLETHFVERVTTEIGAALKDRSDPFLYVLRSTVLPGTVQSTVIPCLAAETGRQPGDGYDVVFHPEFLREGSGVADFNDPPKIVVGERVSGCGAPVLELYEGIDAPRFQTPIETAELVKYADNCFHALKVVFANEIGAISKACGIDGRNVMDIFTADTKLNISSAYLNPGFAFGGSCLPKDLRALLCAAESRGVAVPTLGALMDSNEQQVQRALRLVRGTGAMRVGLYGLAFKPGTDDLRESPLVTLSKRLREDGVQLQIFDPKVRESHLTGSNKAFVKKQLGDLSDLLVKSVDAFEQCAAVILGHPVDQSLLDRWLSQGKSVIDLVGGLPRPASPNYHGLCW